MRCCADHGASGYWPLGVWQQPSVCHKWAWWRCDQHESREQWREMRFRLRRRRKMTSCNVLVIGGKGVGKTSLVQTFVNGSFKKVLVEQFNKSRTQYLPSFLYYRDPFTPFPMNTRRRCPVSDVRILSSGCMTLRGLARSWRPPRGWLTPSSSATGPAMWHPLRLSRIKWARKLNFD